MEQGSDPTRQAPGGPGDRRFLFGMALMLIGVAFLLDRFAIVDVTGDYWPFILIFLGLVRLLFPSRSGQVVRSRRPGVLLLLIGLWGLVSEFHVWGFEYETSWPLLIVIWGLMLVWRSFEGPDRCARPRPLDAVRTAREVANRVAGKPSESER